MHCDVTEREVNTFQEMSSLPVLRSGGEVSDELGDVASLLNCLAENLWHQDCVATRSGGHQSQQDAEAPLWYWAVFGWQLNGPYFQYSTQQLIWVSLKTPQEDLEVAAVMMNGLMTTAVRILKTLRSRCLTLNQRCDFTVLP